jgi:serine/threonine protein kinase
MIIKMRLLLPSSALRETANCDNANFSLVEICKQLLQSLSDIHKMGFAHGDIKMDNVMLNPHTCRLVINDFGLAHPLNGKSPETFEFHTYIWRWRYLFLLMEQTSESSDGVGGKRPAARSFADFTPKQNRDILVAADEWAMALTILELLATGEKRMRYFLFPMGSFCREPDMMVILDRLGYGPNPTTFACQMKASLQDTWKSKVRFADEIQFGVDELFPMLDELATYDPCAATAPDAAASATTAPDTATAASATTAPDTATAASTTTTDTATAASSVMSLDDGTDSAICMSDGV